MNPCALTMGVTAVILFAMHGAIYLVLKTEGELQSTLRGRVPSLIGVFIAAYFIFSIFTFIAGPRLASLVREQGYIFLIAIVGIPLILNIPREFQRGP